MEAGVVAALKARKTGCARALRRGGIRFGNIDSAPVAALMALVQAVIMLLRHHWRGEEGYGMVMLLRENRGGEAGGTGRCQKLGFLHVNLLKNGVARQKRRAGFFRYGAEGACQADGGVRHVRYVAPGDGATPSGRPVRAGRRR